MPNMYVLIQNQLHNPQIFIPNQVEQQIQSHQTISQHPSQTLSILNQNQLLDSQNHLQRQQTPIQTFQVLIESQQVPIHNSQELLQGPHIPFHSQSGPIQNQQAYICA